MKDKAGGDGRGTPFAAELEVGMVCRGHCFGNGLIMRAVGDRMIIAPPLVITHAQIDEMVALIRALPGPDAGRRARARLVSADAHPWHGVRPNCRPTDTA